MGPGPSDVPISVLHAMARPTIGHLDPAFVSLMDEIKALLQYAFQTKNELTIPVSAPGSAGMETCFVNLVEPGEKVIVCINGVFGMRMKENVSRCGGIPVVVDFEWGQAVDPLEVRKVLEANTDAVVLAFVHAETSTGVVSDAQALCALAKEFSCLTIMDAVTSLAGVPVKVDDWGVDAIYSGTQKCLSCSPGLSPVSFSPAAVDKVKRRTAPVQSWFLDLNLVMGYWGEGAKRSYHHTAPVNSLYGLHETLRLLKVEGLEESWKRHQVHHEALRQGLEAIGIQFSVETSCCLPQLNAVSVPDGIDEAQVRTRLLENYGLEIGAGLGKFAGKLWRIGLMGHSACKENVVLCVGALDSVLSQLDSSRVQGAGVAAVDQFYADNV
ncbi:MAG: alanine--glyoxylate aminotransferase family protein [Gammaproteobacteria bacterium]|nr:alanine--glyoxylate aminotransferase family protein [Gammaproteobacteria bacterium]